MLKSGIKYVFSNKKRAIYVGCLGYGNLGDEAVFYAIKGMLNQKMFLYEIPYSKPFSGRIFRKYFFKPPDYIILGGGTVILKGISESFLRIVDSFKLKYPKADVFVFGAGVADTVLASKNGFPTNINDWHKFLNKCKYIFVRGRLSKEALETTFGITKTSIKILHDPSISFLKKRILNKGKTKTIGINFCDILGRIYGQDQEAVTTFFKQAIQALLEQGWKVHLYSTVISDVNFMKGYLSEELMDGLNVMDKSFSLKESLEFFEGIDVFIGQRLHSVIFSAITYTPFYAIEYESKTSDFLLTLGYENRSMRTDNLDLAVLLKRINEIYENIEQEQQKLFELCAKANKEQQSYVKELLSYV